MAIQIFVGVDCDEQQLTMAFIGSQGILRSLSTTSSPLPDRLDTIGRRLMGMIRGIRGEANLRMRNFRGIGIGVPGRYLPASRDEIEKQITQVLDIAVYIEDRDALAAKGRAWLKQVADMAGPAADRQDLDLSVVYGAVKLAVERTPPRHG